MRLGLSPPAVAPGPMRFLISAAIVMKACSTLVAFFALVSKKGMAKESANSCDKNTQDVKTNLLSVYTRHTLKSYLGCCVVHYFLCGEVTLVAD